MENQYYLRIDNNNFGFVVNGIHEIKETDIPISYEDYTIFFNLQNEGKQFKLKETASGDTLFDYIEEYIPEVVETTQEEEGIDEYLLDLEYRISKIELGV